MKITTSKRRPREKREKSRLRRRRDDLELTLSQITAMTGVHETSISRIERGTQQLPERWVNRFAAAYRVEPGHMRWLAADALRSRAAVTTEA